MMNLIKIPQRSDMKVNYKVENEKLKVTIDNIVEIFDFTGLENGIAEEIIVEKLPLNPVLMVEKIGDIFNIEVLRFYSFEEKELFEIG